MLSNWPGHAGAQVRIQAAVTAVDDFGSYHEAKVAADAADASCSSQC